MVELNDKNIDGDWEKYKKHIKEAATHLSDMFLEKGYKIEYNVVDCNGCIIHEKSNGDRRKVLYDKVMGMEVDTGEHRYYTDVKKSTGDAHDPEFMYCLGIYRINEQMERDRRKREEWKAQQKRENEYPFKINITSSTTNDDLANQTMEYITTWCETESSSSW